MPNKRYFKPTDNIDQTVDAIVDEIEKARQDADKYFTPCITLSAPPRGLTHEEFREWLHNALVEQGIDDLDEWIAQQAAILEQKD